MKFSVVIPTYNRRPRIASAIESALAQNTSTIDVEVWVVDDASTDGTVEWLRTVYKGRPVRILANVGSKGPAGGRNSGLAAVQAAGQAEAVALLDSDDVFLPNHLADAAALLKRHPNVDVVFGRARYEQGGKEVPYMGPAFERKLATAPVAQCISDATLFDSRFFEYLLEQGCWFNLSSVVLRANAARERMVETLRVSEDYEFWVRLARNHRFACLHNPQIIYNLGADNVSFEADANVEGHSSQLLSALSRIASYPGLTARQHGVVQAQMASVLFDWGWRSSQAGHLRQAARLHLRSLRLGLRRANMTALAKLLIPRQRSISKITSKNKAVR
ncbi:glycosyltransferase [Aquincola sp. MAHUQ-54]|uniref:Glycosyltransferase n=1 Tax=Aquincola agrisoli TaxID=3119538 RepID=A0AAW9QMM8_9BURK